MKNFWPAAAVDDCCLPKKTSFVLFCSSFFLAAVAFGPVFCNSSESLRMPIQNQRVFVAGAGVAPFSQPGPNRFFWFSWAFFLSRQHALHQSNLDLFEAHVLTARDTLHSVLRLQKRLFAALAYNCPKWRPWCAGVSGFVWQSPAT